MGPMNLGTASVRRIAAGETELVLDAARGSRPRILHWGTVLSETRDDELLLLSSRPWAHGGPDVAIPASFSNELGAGLAGPTGLLAHRDGRHWATCLTVESVEQDAPHRVRVVCSDPRAAVRVIYNLDIDTDSQVLSATSTLENTGDDDLAVDWCAALCLPLDSRLRTLRSFTGRWAGEFQPQDVPIFRGSFVRENRRGRTSHDSFPALIARADNTAEQSGPAAAFQLAWSGNHRLRVDGHNDGRTFVQMGELLLPGEMLLAPGERYTTPALIAAHSDAGLSHVSQRFHAHALRHAGGGRLHRKPRPVHYNTWEAVYFDHGEARLLELVDQAAAIGAERFVLDDGWFGSRRDETRGLGDWWVASERYPNGLDPIAQRLREHGMEFGLWFEPEMVNPDSDLFRAHPDWVLGVDALVQVPSRHQYVLDLTRPEVVDHLYERIAAIVEQYDVDYIKWDMNRDLHHPASDGHAAVHGQTRAVYGLMARLRERFPELEMESCASGGGRADFGVLRHADRVWLSDNNDAGDRQQIQRGASYVLPLAITGTHVGPRECHITRRVYSMAYRSATAIFGHMGLELDLSEETDADLDTLRRAIALHKRHRELIHGGRHVRLDTPDYLVAFGVVAQGAQSALFSCAKVAGHATTLPTELRLAGLEPQRHYRLRLIWPDDYAPITAPSLVETADLLGNGSVFSGEALMRHGIPLPLMHPDSCLVFHLAGTDTTSA